MAQVGGTAAQAEDYINDAWTHVQGHYCHSSLGSQVKIERVGNFIPMNQAITATGSQLQSLFTFTEQNLGDADLMLYMAHDTQSLYGTVGIAWSPVICDPPVYNKYLIFVYFIRFLQYPVLSLLDFRKAQECNFYSELCRLVEVSKKGMV